MRPAGAIVTPWPSTLPRAKPTCSAVRTARPRCSTTCGSGTGAYGPKSAVMCDPQPGGTQRWPTTRPANLSYCSAARLSSMSTLTRRTSIPRASMTPGNGKAERASGPSFTPRRAQTVFSVTEWLPIWRGQRCCCSPTQTTRSGSGTVAKRLGPTARRFRFRSRPRACPM